MLRRLATAAVFLTIMSPGLAPGAHAQHYDVAVQVNVSDGRPSVHAFDFDVLPQFGIVVDNRVFGRSFSISGSSLISADPGFVSRNSSVELDPANLAPPLAGEPLHFNVLAAPSIFPELGGRNLSFWDGTGTVVWSGVQNFEELSIFKGPFGNPDAEIFVDGSTTDVPGFVIGGTSGSGSLHEHIKFLLLPDGLAAPPVGPDDGVYLVLVELAYPAYAEWIPTWLMFKAFAGGQSTLDAAIADVEANFQLPLCDDGIDNDKDGLVDDDDPGCTSPQDMSEREPGSTLCDNGMDDDGDGAADFPDDVGCASSSGIEAPQCQDGVDNDLDGGIDFDGGAAANGGVPLGPADGNCWIPSRNREKPNKRCGLGVEIAFLLVPLALARRRRGRSGPSSPWKLRRRPS